LHQRRDCHLLLTPQLYGRVHSDVPFLERMGKQLPADCSWEVIDPSLDSDGQRRLFAMCDFHLASRYHPAIFGHTGMTPGICIYYEHKALGFMKQIGLERFAFDIRDLHADRLERAVDEVLESYDAIVDQLGTAIPKLQRRARRSTDLAVQLLRERTGG
jgi:polysaccharide pyruvyl transferase WcaK-like protein